MSLRNRLKKDRFTHFVEYVEDEPATVAVCGKKLAGIKESVVCSIEAADCPNCIRRHQRQGLGINRTPTYAPYLR